MGKFIEVKLKDARAIYGDATTPEAIKKLLSGAFSVEELTKPNLPEKYEDLKIERGFVITPSELCKNEVIETNFGWGSFSSEKQALSALAMAKLSHLVKAYNDGWEDFHYTNCCYVIKINPNNNNLPYIISMPFAETELLTLKDRETAEIFLERFEGLIKQYYMIG